MLELPSSNSGDIQTRSSNRFFQSDFVKIATGLILFVTLLLLYTLELYHFDKILESSSLLMRSALIGAIFGAILAWWISRGYFELIHKFQTFVFCIILSAMLFPLFGSLSNRLLASQPETKMYEFVKEDAYGTSRFGNIAGQKPQVDGTYVFFIKDHQHVRIQSQELRFYDKEKGDKIPLKLSKGFWGYDIIGFE